MRLAKALIPSLILSLLLAASAAMPAMAQSSPANWEVYGGLTHQRITATVYVDDDQVSKAVGPDLGWHVGGRYWLNPRLAIGAMIDGIGSTWESSTDAVGLSTESTSAVTGIVATADYLAVAGENWRGLLQVGIGAYTPKMSFKMEDPADSMEMEIEAKSGLGFLIGGQFSAIITERLSLDARGNYRWFSSEVKRFTVDGTPIPVDDTKYDINSWAVGIGLTYRF